MKWKVTHLIEVTRSRNAQNGSIRPETTCDLRPGALRTGIDPYLKKQLSEPDLSEKDRNDQLPAHDFMNVS